MSKKVGWKKLSNKNPLSMALSAEDGVVCFNSLQFGALCLDFGLAR